jgi:Ca2+-binding EF-hand superfamily protein
MSNLRNVFEDELKIRLIQKSTKHMSEEQILLKSFKYFDLYNKGCVELKEFCKVLEKIGLVTYN